MATGGRTEEYFDDLLKCSICLESFKEPKYLPCLHTFCKLCIQTYISTALEKKDEVKCPVCRTSVSSFPETTNSAEHWTDSLQDNHFIVSMIDKKEIQQEGKLCNPCEFNLAKTNAVSWCVVCEEALCDPCSKCHKGLKATAKHKLVSISDIRKGQIELQGSKVIYCHVHPEKVVEVFCVDHSEPCCTLCATLSHRKCDYVISIDDAANDIKERTETIELVSRLGDGEQLLEDVIQNRQENETAIESEVEDISSVLTKTRAEMNDHLDKIENMLRSELEATKKQTLITVSDELNDFSSFQSNVRNWKSLLAAVIKHGSNLQCLIAVHKIKPQLDKLETELQESLKKVRVVSVHFRKSEILSKFEEIVKSLGDINTENRKVNVAEGKIGNMKTNYRTGKIKVIRTVQVAPSGNSSGIFVDDLIVFAVWNTKVVAKYKDDGHLMKELKLPNAPIDIAVVDGKKIAVSTGQSQIYMVGAKDMTLLKTLTLSGIPVYGLCTFNTNQFIFADSSTLTWVDQSTGNATTSITFSGQSFLVSTSGNNDYIYGDGSNSVSYVFNGTKRFTYTNDQLSCPRGIGIDEEKNFYIAGYGSKNIHQITDSGEFIRIISAEEVGVVLPWTVRFKPGTNRFVVTCVDSGSLYVASSRAFGSGET